MRSGAGRVGSGGSVTDLAITERNRHDDQHRDHGGEQTVKQQPHDQSETDRGQIVVVIDDLPSVSHKVGLF